MCTLLHILECMNFFAKHPEKFRRKSEVSYCLRPKTRLANCKARENDLCVENKEQQGLPQSSPRIYDR